MTPKHLSHNDNSGYRYDPRNKHVYVRVCVCPDSKVPGTNMGPIWVLSAPDGPHFYPMNLNSVCMCGQIWN